MDTFDGPLSAAIPRWREAVAAALLPLADEHRPSVLPVAPSRDRAVWDESVLDAVTVAHLRATTGSERGTPWPTPRASDLVRVHRDADRDTYEQLVFARQARLTRATVVAALGQDPADLAEVADGVLHLCEQSTWCWPAHDDVAARRGWILPDVDAPYLDLGAGEVAAQLAWVDAVLGQELDDAWPGLTARIRSEVERRVLRPFLERRDWHWIGLDGDVHNWNPWIHGNVLVSALQLASGADRELAVTLAVEGIDRYLAVLPADGAIDEGYAYWWNGACRAIEALAVLEAVTGGTVDASGLDVLRAVATFPVRTQLADGWVLNVADGPARPGSDQPWHALLRAGVWLDDPTVRAFAASRRDPGVPLALDAAGLGRYLLAITDPAWRDARAEPPTLPDAWWPSTQVRLLRPVDGGRLTLAVKGGHNGEHHNHNDIGEVVLARDGVPVLVDAGRPTYTAATFGPDRYATWCLQSAWHNVPAIGGAEQGVGRTFAASDVLLVDDGAARGLALTLTDAYPDVAGEWRRTAVVHDDDRVSIRDRWELAEGTAPSAVHHLVAGRLRRETDTSLVVTPLDGSGDVRISWTASSPVLVELDERELTDPMHSDVWGPSLVRVRLGGLPASGTLTVIVEPVEEMA